MLDSLTGGFGSMSYGFSSSCRTMSNRCTGSRRAVP
jgi:hypothetical protein